MLKDVAARISLAVLCLELALPAGAAAPDAGQSLRELETRPLAPPPAEAAPLPAPEAAPAPAAAPEAPTVTVTQFSISGNTAIASDVLLAALEDLRNRPLTLAELQGAAQRITALYQREGWVLARAFLPAQEIQEGTVRIEVIEGRYGQVRVHNESRVPDRVVNRAVRDLKSGEGVQGRVLEHALLSLKDLPGVQVRSGLAAGAEVGSSDLDVTVGAGPRYEGDVTLDNYGNSFNGAWRLSGNLALNNPLRAGDRLELRALVSDEDQHYLRTQYDLPLGPWNTRVGAAYSWMEYDLGQDFEVLEASGAATVATVYLSQAWWRQRAYGFSTQLSYDHKTLEDETALFGLNSEKSLHNVTLQLNGYWRDALLGGGVNSYSLAWTSGDLSLDSRDAEVQDVLLRSAGDFQKLLPALLRQQVVTDSLSLLVQARGQLASGNLDGSEKISLGGAHGVRAYPEGEAAGDEGWVASAELRQVLSPQWQAGLFLDAGGVTVNKDPVPGAGDNHRQLSGLGLAAYWQPGAHWQATASAAWPITKEDPTSDTPRDAYVWGRLQWAF